MLNSAEHEIVGIFIFISKEMFISAMFNKKELAIIGNLRFISRKKFMLSCVNIKKWYNLEAWSLQAGKNLNLFMISCHGRVQL